MSILSDPEVVTALKTKFVCAAVDQHDHRAGAGLQVVHPDAVGVDVGGPHAGQEIHTADAGLPGR